MLCNIADQLQVKPSDIIILEGILVLHDPRVRDLMNMKIFVDTGYLCLFVLECEPHDYNEDPSTRLYSVLHTKLHIDHSIVNMKNLLFIS